MRKRGQNRAKKCQISQQSAQIRPKYVMMGAIYGHSPETRFPGNFLFGRSP